MKNINIKELEEKFDPKKFNEKEIYPDIWEIDKNDELIKELLNEYKCLMDFYKKALD
jgi:hypothetical protein